MISPKIRIYQNTQLIPSKDILLDERNYHYCTNVMKCSIGEYIVIFNGREECIGRVQLIDKKRAIVAIESHTQRKQIKSHITLYLSMIKEKALKNAVRQATELGVDAIVPVITRYSINNFNERRVMMHIIEACEQCERVDLVELHDQISFDDLIKNTKFLSQQIIWCNERVNKNDIDFVQKIREAKDIGIFIGPEGGFSEHESLVLKELTKNNVVEMNLGSFILRADTAVAVAISFVSCIREYWKNTPQRIQIS